MKNVFIVLLIAAIGGGVYYYFNHKQKTFPQNSKELIVGNWKVDSLVTGNTNDSLSESMDGFMLNMRDSSPGKYEFEFREDNLVIQTLNGKTRDTTYYQLADKNILLWSNSDTAKIKWTINKLDSSDLAVQDIDSAKFFFKKVK